MSDAQAPGSAAPPAHGACRGHWPVFVFGTLVLGLLVPGALRHFGEWQRERAQLAACALHRQNAEAALQRSDFARAEAALQVARRLCPDDPALAEDALRLLVRRAAAEPATLTDEALPTLDYAIDVLAARPDAADDVSPLVAAGQVALRRGEPRTALQRFTAAVARNPTAVGSHLGAATAHEALGQRTDALAAFEAALGAAPQNLTVLNNLGVYYLDLERPDDAIALFERALVVHDNAPSRLNLAEALFARDRRPEAIEHLRRAAELAPRSAEVRRRLGDVLLLAGRYAEAAEALQRSIDLERTPAALLSLGTAHQGLGQHERALGDFGQALQQDSSLYTAHYRIGQSYEALNRPADAVSAYRKYLEFAEKVPEEAARVQTLRARMQPPAPGPAPGPAVPPAGLPELSDGPDPNPPPARRGTP